MSRFRSVCFTLSNYTDEDVTRLQSYGNAASVEYIVFQRERGANGTPHLQGYISCKNGKPLDRWKRFIGERAHIEKARGTGQQNRDYCTKDETREAGTLIFEWGSLPAQGSRGDLVAVAELVHAGCTEREIFEREPESFIKYSSGIKRAILLTQGVRNWKTRVLWYFGPTGTGKSRSAIEQFPEAYWKPGSTKWWDGYDGQQSVIVDDYRRDLCTFSELLRLFDRYPLIVEFKGGSCHFLARTIVITTPRDPRATWDGRTEEDIQQLERRIEEVKYFGPPENNGVLDTFVLPAST